jgi:hypothetical protein
MCGVIQHIKEFIDAEQEYLDCEGMLCYLNSSLRSKKADKIYKQFISIREKLDVACEFLNEPLAKDYYLALKACGDINSLDTEEKKINYLMAMHEYLDSQNAFIASYGFPKRRW